MSANTISLKWDNPSVESLFRLLRIALGNGESSRSSSKVDWQEVYDLSMQQRVGAIACDGLFALEQCDIDEDLRYKWLGQSMVIEQKATAQWKLACQLASLYAQHGIKTYLLKGISFASYYPKPFHRPSSDLDICLLENFDKGNSLVEQMGVKVDVSETKHSHFTINNIHVENHQFCIGVKGNKRNKMIERRLRQLLNQEATPLGKSSVMRPVWLFNALFSMCHAQTHFLIEEGITLKHVTDWVVLKNHVKSDEELTAFWRECESFGLSRFARTIDELADHIYHGGEIGDLAKMMLQDILCHKHHEESKNKTAAHLNILKMIVSNSWKYKYFSDTTAFRMVLTYIFGHLFDRAPKL